jgi:hypothetical protein
MSGRTRLGFTLRGGPRLETDRNDGNYRKGSLSRPVGRVLSSAKGGGVTINLGPRLPGVSSGQPEGLGRAPLAPSYLALLRAGFRRPASHLAAGGLLPHHFTLIRRRRTVCFCATFRRVAPPGSYPARCPCGARTFLSPLSERSPGLLKHTDYTSCMALTRRCVKWSPPPLNPEALEGQAEL